MNFRTIIELTSAESSVIDRVTIVTAAIVDHEAKRLFMQRRSARTRFAWHWGTPGGTVASQVTQGLSARCQ
jgi:8-oxo-dGTP pyrophosphatase MutT (NUDIX family)